MKGLGSKEKKATEEDESETRRDEAEGHVIKWPTNTLVRISINSKPKLFCRRLI